MGGMTAEDCATKIRTLLKKLNLDCTCLILESKKKTSRGWQKTA